MVTAAHLVKSRPEEPCEPVPGGPYVGEKLLKLCVGIGAMGILTSIVVANFGFDSVLSIVAVIALIAGTVVLLALALKEYTATRGERADY